MKKQRNFGFLDMELRHTLSFGKKDRLYYCDVRGYPAKGYIAQFHCNDGMGKSLRALLLSIS